MNKARYVAPSAVLMGDLTVGEGTWIGNFTTLEGVNAKLTIGKNCSIADGVRIYTHSTHEQTTEGKPRKIGAVTIGDNVAVGANSVIFYGARIGDGVVIPALTVVKPYMKIENNERQQPSRNNPQRS